MSIRIAVVMTAFIATLCVPVLANDESPDVTFSRLKKGAQNSNWELMLSQMTPPTQKTMIDGTISGAAAVSKREFPPGPKGDRHRQRIKEVFVAHEVDQIEFPAMPDFSKGVPSKEAMEKYSEQRKVYAAKILECVKDRNGLLNDLTRVMADAPIPAGSTLMFRLGEITEVQTDKEFATAIVEVDPSRLSNDPTVINIVPPSPVKFQWIDGKWKYDGVDTIKQQAMAQSHMDLMQRDGRPEDKGNFSFRSSTPKGDTGSLQLTASWVPFDDESTYGFAKKWPEINQMKPVAEMQSYDHSFFELLTPTPEINVGDTWRIDENAMLPLLQQFHQGASCKLHHGGPTGAYGCLIGKNEQFLNILIRLHGEIRHEDGWYYTVSQFEGHLVWDDQAKQVLSFRLFVPPVRTNVDINRSATVEEIRNKTEYKGLNGVDIGFIPKMELTSGQDATIQWGDTVALETAKDLLAKRFYRSAQIHWMPWEEAVSESQKTGKPLHVVALFGTLYDESC